MFDRPGLRPQAWPGTSVGVARGGLRVRPVRPVFLTLEGRYGEAETPSGWHTATTTAATLSLQTPMGPLSVGAAFHLDDLRES